MKIAVASLGDPRSVSTWSGIPANIISALEALGHEIYSITLTRTREPWHYSWLRRFYHRVRNKWFLAAVEKNWLLPVSKQLDEKVSMLQPNLVIVIHGDWLAYSTFKVPALIIHDTTFASIVDYYDSFKNLSERSLRMGHQMYRLALERADAAVFSATWASKSALAEYKIPSEKIFTIPFGANISISHTRDDVASMIRNRILSPECNLLFVGTHWERKGGPDALKMVQLLNMEGIKATLTVIGCCPQIPAGMHKVVRVIGYLKKENDAENKMFIQCLKSAHALVLLSKAECFGCVYCEANAYGLPALARDTGGVSDIIREGVNGILMKHDDTPEDFSRRWIALWRDKNAYGKLAMDSYLEYEQRLNYKVFASKLDDVIVNVVENKSNNN